MLRKLLYTTALILGVGTLGFAQADRAATTQPSNDVHSLSNSQNFSSARKVNPSNQVNALFDIQFNYNLSAARGSGGNAGICWTGTEFWASAWGSDSIFTLDANGVVTSRFKVAGVGSPSSGVRAFTWDGTSIYAGANTTSIFEINPTTKTLVSTIVSPTPVRGLAYDSTANGGAGGFWVSNFDTDISLISRTGTLLNAIPAVAHGLTAMYGIAVDHYSTGGPFIWVFDQTSSAGQSDLRRINIATAMPDLIRHDVMSDVGAAGTSGLAGGLCITWGLDTTGARSIVGILQGTPNDRLFGYELNDFVPPGVDVVAQSLNFSPPLTFVPKHLTGPTFWDMDVSNRGTSDIDTLSFILNIDSAGTNLFTDTNRLFNFVSGAVSNISSPNAFTASYLGEYNVTGFLNTGALVDEDNRTDTISYNLTITDSTLGLDNSVIESSLGIGGAGLGGVLGQKFIVSSSSYASSVSFFCSAPTAGDTVSAELYTFTSSPGSLIASTGMYIFTALDEANGVFLNLGFTSAPYQIAAGTYFVGVREYSSNVTLAYTSFNFHPNTGFAQVAPSAAWQTMEGAGFDATFILRFNVLDPLFVGIPQVYKQDVFTMHPNPASNLLTVKVKDSNASAHLSMFDISGREVFSQIGLQENNTIDLHTFSEGLYIVRMVLDGNVYSEKVTIAK
jgi:hypothetical protein